MALSKKISLNIYYTFGKAYITCLTPPRRELITVMLKNLMNHKISSTIKEHSFCRKKGKTY